jgi:membrane associated rhomboid family serine protease
MFPISDVIPSRTRPVVTISLIVLNTVAYLYLLQLDETSLQRLVFGRGVVPARFSLSDAVTSLFLHADIVHVGGNMVFLWIFGDNVEDRLGHLRYLGFYLVCGVAGALAQTFAEPASFVPMIGASGAIAGVMGAYFLLYPHSRVLTVVFLVFFLDIIEIPAVFLRGVWFLLQLVHGALASDLPGGGIAFWAHAGGFVVGVLVGTVLRLRAPADRAYWEPRVK